MQPQNDEPVTRLQRNDPDLWMNFMARRRPLLGIFTEPYWLSFAPKQTEYSPFTFCQLPIMKLIKNKNFKLKQSTFLRSSSGKDLAPPGNEHVAISSGRYYFFQ